MTPPPSPPGPDALGSRTIQLVLHYDGSGFCGWQRQLDEPTVQGALEDAISKLTQQAVTVMGAGRTDAGVHARGQAAGVRVPSKWTAGALRKALNATLPESIWVAEAHEMAEGFHARYSAIARRYSYRLGLDEGARSPFRRRYEWAVDGRIDRKVLDESAGSLVGEHAFLAFAVKGTAPATDDHRCTVRSAAWSEAPGGLMFEIEANRFLHHMVRYLVGTMVQAATGRRAADSIPLLLVAPDNRDVSPPAPPHALFLEQVRYPGDLYL
ncbi:MAG TPA: tRNA pseudouridine(38-40) synthase TruA [Gemmatimonadaceae bacterium]|nr:tRNA pseudouridine(38-40) synthase TruA [Gemmatimonadaceae bacterium]